MRNQIGRTLNVVTEIGMIAVIVASMILLVASWVFVWPDEYSRRAIMIAVIAYVVMIERKVDRIERRINRR